jgi:N-acetylglucosamine-6-phosphate deacetylase
MEVGVTPRATQPIIEAPVALVGARVFDGARLIEGHAVVIDCGAIVAVVPEREVPASVNIRRVEGLLAPGLIDSQVNGGGGVLFNSETTVAGIAAIGAAHRSFGTVGFLPTLITDVREKMAEALTATEAAIAAKVPGVLGVHLEGPFLNPERKGVHDPRLMRVIDANDVARITSARAGRIVMTIAPEKMPIETIGRLSAAGIVLSAGHTTASYDTLVAARKAGLSGFTHLFNAMPPLAGREPGPIGAALDDADAFVGLIVDLFHVSAASLRIAIAAKGWQRMMLVTDAMPTVGTELTEFDLDGARIIRKDGRLTRADDGTIAGSDLDMASSVRNAVNALGLPLEAALHMASRAPAEFLGLGRELGRIASGYRASLVLFDDGLGVTETWIDGVDSAGT